MNGNNFYRGANSDKYMDNVARTHTHTHTHNKTTSLKLQGEQTTKSAAEFGILKPLEEHSRELRKGMNADFKLLPLYKEDFHSTPPSMALQL